VVPPPPPWDRILRYGLPRGIRSYDVPPLPRGIKLSTVAPAVGLTHRGIVLIFFESLVLPLKGEFMKNVCMMEQYHTGTITFRLYICSGLIDCKFEFFSQFKFTFEKALGYESGSWGKCFDEKKQRQNFFCQCPLNVAIIHTLKVKSLTFLFFSDLFSVLFARVLFFFRVRNYLMVVLMFSANKLLHTL
jgi:hypothetical protein